MVFACDVHGKAAIGDRDRVMAAITNLIEDRDKLCQRALAGINVLGSDPRVTGRIAAVGYCFGGRVVLELARSGADLAGAISVHGSLATAHPANPGAVKAKVLACHGALDPHVPTAQLAGFIQEMNAAGADYRLIVYGGAMHSFTHDVGPQAPGSHITPSPTSARPWPSKRSSLRFSAPQLKPPPEEEEERSNDHSRHGTRGPGARR